MEDPKEKEQQQPQQAEHCPYCGRALEPGRPCTCPQGRMLAVMKREMAEGRRPEPPEPPGRREQERPQPLKAFLAADDFDDFDDFDEFDEDELEEWEREFFSPQAILRRFRDCLLAPFRNFFPFFAAYFRAPLRAAEAACRGRDLPLALLYLLLLLAGGGSFFLALTRRCGVILGQGLAALFSLAPVELPDPRRLRIQVRDGRCFFYGMLMVLCLALLLSLTAALACRLAKVRLGLCRSLILCAVSGILPALLLLAAGAVMLPAPSLALILALLAALLYAMLVFHGVCRAAGSPEGGLFYFGLGLLIFLAFALTLRFCAALLRPSVEHLLQSLFR